MKCYRLFCLPLAAFALPAAAAGTDELWEVSVHMNDRITGSVLTTQAHQQCLREGAKADEIVPLRAGCQMVDQQVSGSRLTFRFECSGKDRLSGDGDIDRPTPDTYSGRMQMQGTSSKGRKINIGLDFSGRRVGNCAFGEALPPAPSPDAR